MPRNQKLPFDIRDYVPGSNNDPDSLQHEYDRINRTILLVGDIPLSKLLKIPLSQLIDECEPHLRRLPDYGLVINADQSDAFIRNLRSVASGETLESLLTRPQSPSLNALIDALSTFVIPLPAHGVDEQSRQRRAAGIHKLIDMAPSLTLKDLLTRGRESVPEDVLAAIHEVRDAVR
jgi:hypothetical protein